MTLFPLGHLFLGSGHFPDPLKAKVGGRKSSRTFETSCCLLPRSVSSACLTPHRHHQVFLSFSQHPVCHHLQIMKKKTALFQLFLLFITAVKGSLSHPPPSPPPRPLHRRFSLLCPRCITAPSPSNGFPMLRPSCRSRGRSIPFPASVARASCLEMHEPPVGVIVLIPSLLTSTQTEQQRTGRPPQTPPT